MFLVPSCAILFWMSRRSCSVTQNSMRIGLVRSAIGYSPPQTTTDNFLRIWGGHSKKYPLSYFNGQFRAKTWYLLRKNFSHFTTDKFSAFVRLCAKFCCSLYNGHFFRRLAGKAGIKFPNRKVPLNLQRTLFRLNAGMAAKYF